MARPNVYFGVKPRSTQPLLVGLAWQPMPGRIDRLRHTCEQGDRLKRYGWTRHDGVAYGEQDIVDNGAGRAHSLRTPVRG
jgi:mannosyl-oligosaccharide glucosidase